MNAIFAIFSAIFILFLYILSCFENVFSRPISKFFGLVGLSAGMVLLAFRGFGLDFFNYKEFYNGSINANTWGELFYQPFEPLFVALMLLFKHLNLGFEAFYLFLNLSAASMAFYAYGRKFFSATLVFLFFLFYFFGYMDVTRGFFVSCAFVFSVSLFFQKKYLIFVVIMVLAPFVHYSFLLCWVLFFLISFKMNLVRYLFLLFASLILGLLLHQFLTLIEYSHFKFESFKFLKEGLRYLTTKGATPDGGFISLTHAIAWYFLICFLPIFAIIINFLSFEKIKSYHDKTLMCLHTFSCWGSIFFVFFASLGPLLIANRLFYLLSLGLPVITYAMCLNAQVKPRIKIRYIEYQALVWFLFFGVFLSFLYTAKAHIPGSSLYLGI